MTTEEKAKEKIDSILSILSREKIETSGVTRKEYNYELTAGKVKSNLKVQIYFGKKGVKTILQGDEKSDLYKQVNGLISDEPKFDLCEPELNEPDEYIGTDECGKGDFFGPLVVAAVYVNRESKKKLLQIGVRDSKDLNDLQIKTLGPKIKHIVNENFSIIKVNPVKYNELYNKYGNLNRLLNWAHSKSISNLLDNINCKFIITDKFSNKDLDISVMDKHSDVVFVQETKAEKYIGVAAASILARDYFLNWFEIHAQAGKNLPKGSSLETEVYAKKLLRKIGEEKFEELAKLHFKTFKRIKE